MSSLPATLAIIEHPAGALVEASFALDRPAGWSPLRRPTSSKPPSESPPNKRPPRSAASRGLDAIAIPKRSIWEQGESALGVAQDELRHWIDQLRREVGPPWAQDQKLAALAAWIALARSS